MARSDHADHGRDPRRGRLPDLPDNLVALPPRMSRRALLRRGIALGLTAGAGGLLAACGERQDLTGEAPGTPGPERTFGGSGVADRAVAAARDLPNADITLVHASGNASNFTPFFPEWEELTGQRVTNFEIPIGEIVDRIIAGATARTPDWDIVVVQPRLYGDLDGAGALADLTPYAERYDPMISDPTYGFIPPQDEYTIRYDGRVFGLSSDADHFVFLYRSDLFEDPSEQAAYEDEFGRELAPPRTWEEFNENARFFTRPEDGLYGAAELVADGWGFWWWQLRYASQAAPNAYYFDDDMTPLVDGPEGIRAMELLVELRDYMPRDVPSWDWTQTYGLFAEGGAAQKTAFGALAKFVNDPSVSEIVGRFKDAPMPGTVVDGELIRRSIFAFGNSLAVWGHSENPEQAYLFAQWITSPEMSSRMTAQPGFSEPYRLTDVDDPTVRELYTPSLMDNWIEIAQYTVPEIMLRGAQEYGAALDRNVNAAFVGSITPEQAMANTAREWEETTERLGREEQAEAWRFLKQSYPGA